MACTVLFISHPFGVISDIPYNDFWYLFLDTYPPASPYPSKRGDSRWRSVGRHVVEYGKICDYGTSKNPKDKNVGMCYRVLICLLYVEKHENNNYDVSCTMML